MTTRQQYTGLTDAEVLASRTKHGANTLTPPPKESLWKRYFEKLTGPLGHHIPGWKDGDALIFILEIAAILSVIISCAEYFGWWGLTQRATFSVFFEPLGILIAILLATGISFIFELKADKEFSLLNQVRDEESVQVIRNGNHELIPKCDVVVGDIVIIETGAEIPADAELKEAISLRMDESSLTGEPMCNKTTDPSAFDAHATYPSNHVMRGTKVMEGHGVCEVFAVGDATENGKVFQAAQIDNSVKTPLNEQLDRLAKLITGCSYAVGGFFILCRIVMYAARSGWDWSAILNIDFITYILETVMLAVTLIVAAVPEGLPMAVALSLAYSMRKMLKTNNLVRKMHACETMGATTVICTDKTGTLTQNQMQVHDTLFYGVNLQHIGQTETDDLLVNGIAVNSTAELDRRNPKKPTPIGNPTEGALLLWLEKHGINYQEIRNNAERMAEIPFSTENKYMATVVKDTSGRCILYLKGAPEIVLALCKRCAGDMTEKQIFKQLADYQQQAMRTLGFAYQILQEGEEGITDGQLTANDLTFLGITAISDPVRSDVPAAVKECLDAGIRVIIVTGDNPATAREIGREIGIWDDNDLDTNIITGPEMAKLDDKRLAIRAKTLKIVARARPMDKKRLVEILQANNEVVAVTGDGTNDAPALKTAQVGLSMGDGTSVAKEASDITIIDNSFASIGRAVMWGRSLYHNIQKFIIFQLTVNVVACLTILVGSMIGAKSPLTVTQLLWINLIMDTFAAMALASLPPTRKVMTEKPRARDAFIITKPMRKMICWVGFAFFLILFVLMALLEYLDYRQIFDIRRDGSNNDLTFYEITFFFTIFVMLQFWNLFNVRAFATGRSAFHFKDCESFLLIAAIIFFGQILIVNFGGEFFQVERLHFIDWVFIIGNTSFVLIIGELIRWRKAHKKTESTTK
ncbi:MAG: calcium-translocating P-type ATPase, PMCA-type [Prevotella sp.]|nr:calcium-translocating P-type ATPase, PMCA-type [Prevotella sp.]